MAKIIKLNENDLKRIVTKVLNERRLNEDDKVTNGLSPGAITQDVADQLKYTENETDPWDRFESICNVCTSGADGLGPITQSEGALDGIAEKIYEAIEQWDWYSFGAGTSEKKVGNGIRNTKTFPDFCFMINRYSSKYEDFAESMDGDFNKEYEQRTYLVSPVADVIRYSTKLIEKKSDVKVDPIKVTPGGGGSEDNWNMYRCVIEHPKAQGEKFADGKRTRFRIGTDYYMGNGKRLRKGIEIDYSCEDKEFDNVDFEDKENRNGNIKSVNAKVKDIQKFLTDEGYDISSDGEIGKETAGAIIDYIVDNNSSSFKSGSVIELQKKINSCYSKKIEEDGKVGPQTLNAIADALESAQDGDLCK